MTRVALLLLGGLLLVAPAQAAEFRVDAEPNGAIIIKRPCDGGPCSNGKYLVQLPEGRWLRISNDAYVTRENGELVLHEGKTRTVLPKSGLILKDAEGRSAVVLTEGVTGTR